MAWARYDDGFSAHRKVSALRAQGRDGLAAIGLHVLLNTWSRREGMGGYVPTYMTVEQAGGKFGTKLADLLENVVLLDPADGGWEIHDYETYGPPSGDVPADERKRRISQVRAEAGRKGGKAKAANAGKRPSKEAGKPLANQLANGHQTSSPVPVPDPVVPTTELAIASPSVATRTLNQRANDLAGHYAELVPLCNHQAVAAIVKTALRAVESGRANYTDTQIAAALERLADDNRTVTANTLRHELDGPPISRAPAMATGTQRALAAHQIANRLREAGQ